MRNGYSTQRIYSTFSCAKEHPIKMEKEQGEIFPNV